MEKITITEALSEINLIKKKIAAKQTKIQSALIRAAHFPDPFKEEGGSEEMIKRESQSLRDLNLRFMKIRANISLANLNHDIVLAEKKMSIHDWLIWRRELSAPQVKFTGDVHKAISAHQKAQSSQPQVYKNSEEKVELVRWLFNADYAEWLRRETDLNEMLEKLDGQLSLKNATILIEI